MINKVELIPFDDYWMDCFYTTISSVLTSREPSYRYYFYLNDYHYYRLNEKNYGEILMLSYYPDGIEKWLQCSLEDVMKIDAYYLKNEKNYLEEIKELILDRRHISIGVDLFYWNEESLLWQTHHTSHYSMITGFDDEKKVIYAMEDNIKGKIKIYEIPEERVILAFENSTIKNPPVLLYTVAEKVKPFELRLEYIQSCAQRLVDEISEIKLEGIWDIEGKKDSYGIVESSLWGLKTIISRHKANVLLFNAMKDLKLIEDEAFCDSLIKKASELFHGWTLINNRILKYKVSTQQRFNLQMTYKDAYSLLDNESQMWKQLVHL